MRRATRALVFLLGWLPARFRSQYRTSLVALLEEIGGGLPLARRLAAYSRAAADILWVGTALRLERATTWAGARSLGTIGASPVRDLLFAVRSLRGAPAFTIVAVAAIAIGVGGATAIFTVVDGVLLRDLPYERPDSLVSVWKAWPAWRDDPDLHYLWDRVQFPWADYLSVRDGASTLSAIAAHGQTELIMSGPGPAALVSVGEASANLFSLLGVQPLIGRAFLASEVPPDGAGARVAVLSHELWSRVFARRGDILGEALTLAGESFVVVGVLPAGFRLQSELLSQHGADVDGGLRDLWVPLQTIARPRGNDFEIIGRLLPGVGVDQARADIQAHLVEGPGDQLARVIARKSVVTEGFGVPLFLLLAAAGLLLLVACTNVMGLLVGRAANRDREIAVRAALGATRGRIVRQLLTESVLLGVMGAAGGLGLAALGTELLLAVAPPLPRATEIAVDLRVLSFAAAIGVGAGVMFGVGPALVLTRRSQESLRSRGRAPGLTRLQRRVTSAQIGLTVVLLSTGALFGRSLIEVTSVPPGFDAEDLSSLTIAIPQGRSDAPEDRARFVEAIVAAAEGVPGVMAASATTDLPFPGLCCENSVDVIREDTTVEATHLLRRVTPGYLQTVGIPLIRGRPLVRGDGSTLPVPTLVSASLANAHWPGTTALGRRISWDGDGDLIVVGVTGDVRQRTLGAPVEPTIYIPFAYRPKDRASIVVRTRGQPATTLRAVGEAIQSLDSEIPVGDSRPLRDLMLESEADSNFRAVLVWTFASLATLLVAVGIFAVTGQALAARRRELGIRAALGAHAQNLIGLVVRDGLSGTIPGLLVGLLVARRVAALVEPLLFGVEPGDSSTYLAVTAIVVTVSGLASYAPARRVVRIAPAIVLADD